jgi:type VI secretion system protein
MRGKRLLERLQAIDEHPEWRGQSDPGTAIASVLKHLGQILNTHQGSALTAPDLGMPDFTRITGSLSADSLPEMAETISRVITRYEPRLTGVKVDFESQPDNPFMITFKLTARVRVENREMPVSFATVLDSDGHMTVVE